MKHIYATIILILMFSLTSFGEDLSRKFGKPTQYELEMTSYQPDTSAKGVVMYDIGQASHQYLGPGYGIGIVTKYAKKIKILKEEGKDMANIAIPCLQFANGGRQESISELEAWVYNLEDGKIVKQKLDKEHIFKEKVNDVRTLTKLGLQGVKVGSVIEYKYTITTLNSAYINDWIMQCDVPVLFSQFIADIPEFYAYTFSTKGYEKIDMDKSSGSAPIPLKGSSSCRTTIVTFTAYDLPKWKTEPFVWCDNDFISRVTFELSGFQIPGEIYKDYSQTWEDVEKTLNADSKFVSNIRGVNPYKDEVSTIVMAMKDDQMGMVEKIFELVKSKIRWNNYYSMFDNNPRDAIKDGTGNNAQINAILYRALKDAKLKPYLILMSLRGQGRLPFTHASIDALNTFIVAVDLQDGTTQYMDGSAVNSGLNVLPTHLLVDNARVYRMGDGPGGWVDLTNICPSASVTTQNITIKEGKVISKMTSFHSNTLASKYKSDYLGSKNKEDYIEKTELKYNITIDSLESSGTESMSNAVKEDMKASRAYSTNGSIIYINPLFIPHITQNPFTQSERKLPIEFDFPYSHIITSIITIPDGYVVEELPKSASISLADKNASMIYRIAIKDNTIQLNYTFKLKQLVFMSEEYADMKSFWAMVAEKNGEMVVLKKKEQ